MAEFGRHVWAPREVAAASPGHEDLLVFGYSCRLFRDNEKAVFVDRGQHLIPWMGDTQLMIDRYDVRGALYDLSEAEARADQGEELTEEERLEEERCNYERYLALHQDEFQYQANQDEEAKRLMVELGSSTYGQVAFSYDGQTAVAEAADGPAEPAVQQVEEEEAAVSPQPTGYFPLADEDTFVPPPELNVPQGMVVPETVKQNKIIVKTSKFIVTQGGQMEIVIKTKQAGNPMFAFLSFDNPLNAYYKHMVAMLKNGRYNPADDAEQARPGKESDKNGDQYLHPSLSAGIKPDLTPGTPTTVLKPSSDCAYSKLIHKIKEKQKNSAVVERVDSPAPASPRVCTPAAASTPLTNTPEVVRKDRSVTAANTPVSSPKLTKLVDYPSFNNTKENDSAEDLDDVEANSGSQGASEYSKIKWPPPDVQMVIDKMASYIIKNGDEFETMVCSRDDPRFSFLKKDHEYYPYYRCKIRLYNEVYGDLFKDNAETSGAEDQSCQAQSNGGAGAGSAARKDKRGATKGPSTICFSIKSREQDVNLDRHSTFPVESSSTDDEDMDEEEKEKRRLEREERRKKRKQKEKEERERQEREEKERREKEEKEKSEKNECSSEGSGENDDMYDIFKYAQEMGRDGDGEDQSGSEKKPRPRRQEAARPGQDGDHTAAAHPERKQQERRKKAAMFLSRLKRGTGDEDPPAQPVYGPQLPPEVAAQLLNSASQSPRSSVTSTRPSTPSRSRSQSASPGPGIPMPPREAPAPPPPPPTHSPSPPREVDMVDLSRHSSEEVGACSMLKNEWATLCDGASVGAECGEQVKGASLRELSVLSGTSKDGRRSQSTESKSSKSRALQSARREKTRSRKKQRHGRSESRSPSSRRERKKRKRSRSRSRRHKKRRSRSKSPKTHRSSHKKKRRKHSGRHQRGDKKSKKCRRRSVSSSSSDSSWPSVSSSRSSSPSEDEVQVIESPVESKRESRASSVASVGSVDTPHSSVAAASLARINEEPATPSLPPAAPAPAPAPALAPAPAPDEVPAASDGLTDGGAAAREEQVHKEGKKPLFDPHTSAAMAKIAQGLRAKVHALLDKESKL